MREAKALLSPRREADPRAYALRPVAFAEEVLGVTTLTDDQKRILCLLHEPPFRVLVPSAHDVGKTFVAAVATLYWFYSFDPGLVLTTAPTEKDVIDLLWAEIRLLCARARVPLAPPFVGPKAPEIYDHADHYAKGYVSRQGQEFQGRHRPRMLFIKDEANNVEALHWLTTRTMFDPSLGHAELAIFNPTKTTTQAYQEDVADSDPDGRPRWSRVRLSALDHPNVLRELRGEAKPIKGAVSVSMIDDWVAEWTTPLGPGEVPRATDIEWRPGSGTWYRPGPVFQSRALGLWPDAGDGVWSPALWEACFPAAEPARPLGRLPEIGVDCSLGKGEDFYAQHCRWGAVALFHHTANTMDAVSIAGQVRESCRRAASYVNLVRAAASAEPVRPRQVRVKIDDDGTGNAVAAMLRREGYDVRLVSAATVSLHPDQYPRMRDEAWFLAAEKARRGLIFLGRLDRPTQARLRQQLLAPAWDVDSAGRRAVERKDQTKDKIGRSPDDADAFNLAYLEAGELSYGPPVENPEPVRLGPYQVPVATDAPAREPFTPPDGDDRRDREPPRLFGRR